MKGIGYCRVSTDDQVIEGSSLEFQEMEIKEYCSRNNIDLVDVYIDPGVSAYKVLLSKRPAGHFVFEHIMNKDIDCIVAISNDRMFRQVGDSIAIGELCKRNDIKIIYTRQSFEAMDEYSSFLIENITAVMNQGHSILYANKVKSNLTKKARKGEWIGKSPFGYDLVNSHLAINEEEAKIIRLIFELYLTKSWGAEKICNYLNENGIKPPKNSQYWSKTSVICMLKNDAYKGTTVFNRRAPKRSGRKYNDKSEWIITENTHPAIISKEDFDKVQEDMEKKRKNIDAKNIDRTKIGSAPLAGLMFCTNCGNVYTYTSGVSHNGNKIYYYQCGSKRHGKTVCKRHMIPAILIEKFILYRVQEILTSDMYKERFEEQLKIRLDGLNAKKKDIADIKRNISKLTTQKEKIFDLLLDEEDKNLIDTYKEKLSTILNQISLHNSLLEEYSEIDIKSEEELLRKQFETNYDDISFVDFQNLDRDQQKILFNYLIERIEVDEFSVPGETDFFLTITIHLRIPGFAPKYALDSLKGLKSEYYTRDNKKKSNHSKNGSKIDGGEGGI